MNLYETLDIRFCPNCGTESSNDIQILNRTPTTVVGICKTCDIVISLELPE